MGYVHALNPHVGVFVYEVAEPAGVHEEQIITRGILPCSTTGNELAYYANWEPDGLFHVYATEAEAKDKLNAVMECQAAWDTDTIRRPKVDQLHYPTVPSYWRAKTYFHAAQKKSTPLCSSLKSATNVTTVVAEVTCRQCRNHLRRLHGLDKVRFVNRTKAHNICECGKTAYGGRLGSWMVADSIWKAAGYQPKDVACKSCLTARLRKRFGIRERGHLAVVVAAGVAIKKAA